MINLSKLKIANVLSLSLLCIVLSTDISFAYIDPGSGSMLLQVLIASILGILTVIKIYWARLKSGFSRNSEKTNSEEPQK